MAEDNEIIMPESFLVELEDVGKVQLISSKMDIADLSLLGSQIVEDIIDRLKNKEVPKKFNNEGYWG